MVRLVFPHAMIVTDAFHLHRQVLEVQGRPHNGSTAVTPRRARLLEVGGAAPPVEGSNPTALQTG